jgi:hypothetical protein
MRRTRLSDGYTVVLVAIGPGMGACALLALAEFGSGWSFLPALLSYYAVALLAFLPGLPAFAACLARAVPRPCRRPRLAWLLLAPVGLVWHVIVVDACHRWCQSPSPVDWWLVARYAAVLSVTTAGTWAVIVSTSKRNSFFWE